MNINRELALVLASPPGSPVVSDEWFLDIVNKWNSQREREGFPPLECELAITRIYSVNPQGVSSFSGRAMVSFTTKKQNHSEKYYADLLKDLGLFIEQEWELAAVPEVSGVF